MQDHESVERGDATIAAHIRSHEAEPPLAVNASTIAASAGVIWSSPCKVANLWHAASPRQHEWEAVDAGAAQVRWCRCGEVS